MSRVVWESQESRENSGSRDVISGYFECANLTVSVALGSFWPLLSWGKLTMLQWLARECCHEALCEVRPAGTVLAYAWWCSPSTPAVGECCRAGCRGPSLRVRWLQGWTAECQGKLGFFDRGSKECFFPTRGEIWVFQMP